MAAKLLSNPSSEGGTLARFQPGQEKPTGSGRKRGTRNKRSQHLIDALDNLGVDVPGRLAELLPRLSPEKQADVLMGLMGYLYPKLKMIEQVKPENEMPQSITVRFVSPDRSVKEEGA